LTISSSTRKAGPFTGTGTTANYPFTFKIFQASDLLIVKTSPTGDESDLVLTTDYTVSINADQDSSPGGSITLTAGNLAVDYKVTLTTDVAPLQGTDLSNQGGFYPKVITNALDKLTILTQQLAEQVSRAVKVRISSTTTGDELTEELFDARDQAVASAASAASSSSSAASSATAASSSATAAGSSQTASSSSQSAAAASATSASSSASSASSSLLHQRLRPWLQTGLTRHPVQYPVVSTAPSITRSMRCRARTRHRRQQPLRHPRQRLRHWLRLLRKLHVMRRLPLTTVSMIDTLVRKPLTQR